MGLAGMIDFVRLRGPLGILRGGLRFGERRLARVPAVGTLFKAMGRAVDRQHAEADAWIDRKYGTDTGGKIPLAALEVEHASLDDCIWFETTSAKHFDTIMRSLRIDFPKFTFIDFGSGKGRLLLLAAGYDFAKVIGVEFARDLHEAAERNIALYERHPEARKGRVASIHMDAARYEAPATPLVLFFFTPFKGQLMQAVLERVQRWFSSDPRDIVIIYYGNNQECLSLFESMGFRGESLKMPMDFRRMVQYRCRIFRLRPTVHAG